MLQIIQKGDFVSGQGNYVKNNDMGDIYIDYVVNGIKLQRYPVKVIVDGGNGVGGPYLTAIFTPFGL